MSADSRHGSPAELIRRTHAAAGSAARLVETRHGRPAAVGDLFLLPQDGGSPLEWAVLVSHPHRPGLLLVVPADTHPLVGSSDLAVPAGSPSGPLSLRCGFGVWLDDSFLRPELRSGALDQEDVDRARRLHRFGEICAFGAAGVEPEMGDPELEDWFDVLARAQAMLLSALRSLPRARAPHLLRYFPLPLSAEAYLAQSRAEAAGLQEELLQSPPDRRRRLARDAPRFHSWGLCELLCEESRRTAAGDALRAIELAELAILISSLLGEVGPVEIAWLGELRAYSWAHLGNARRVLGELRQADEAFRRAGLFWESGGADALGYGARILGFLASLRRDQRRLPEALALLDRALAAPSGRELSGLILVNQAWVCEELGDVERAIALLREAASLLDPRRDPRPFYCLHHNLLLLLANTGRAGEARELLPKVSLLCRELGSDLDRLRLRWVEGKIAAAAGETREAVRLLETVGRQLLSRGMAYDAALASLDLAVVHAEAGHGEEVRAIARDILPIFQAQEVHREALAAITLLIRATEMDAGSGVLLRQIADDLRRAGHGKDSLPKT
jgi:tetratricopeptide (TPR) repeat protein